MAGSAEGTPAGFGMVVRVAGLPVGVLESLRCDHAITDVRALIEVRRWLAAEGQRLSDVLYEVIGGLTDCTAKPFLVALRRAVFTGRRPGNREWSAELERLMPGEVASRIRAWMMRLDQRDDLAGRLPHLVADALKSRRERLRAAVADEAFQYGLVHGGRVITTV